MLEYVVHKKKPDCCQEQKIGNYDRKVGICTVPTTFDPVGSGPRYLTAKGLSENKTYMSKDE